MTDPLINTHLGQYHLIELIGRGGMATVYKAHQASLDRLVAVKVLQHLNNPELVARFKAEARAIALLQHPYILPVHDYGEHEGLLYLVLQYVEGGASLVDLTGKPMAPQRAILLVNHLLSALEYAHSRGVIHRDIKPANVLLPAPEWPMLADFGLSKLLGASLQQTAPGVIMGTISYMSPEQVTSQPIDARSDLYATGIVLYELLTGRVPFQDDSPMAVLIKQAYAPPPSLRQINSAIPIELEAVITRALAKDPGDRYQSAAEMAADLEHIALHLKQPSEWSFSPTSTPALDVHRTIRLASPVPISSATVVATAPQLAVSSAPDSQPVTTMPPAAPRQQRSVWMFVALAMMILLIVGGAAIFLWPRADILGLAKETGTVPVATSVSTTHVAVQITTSPPTTSPTVLPSPTVVATTAPVAAVVPSATGKVIWGDQALWNDAVTISINGLPPPDAGQVYAAWLSSNESSLALGTFSPGNGDTLTLTYTSPTHANLIANYDRVYITRVPESAATAEVVNIVMAGTLPEEALIHIRHALVSYETTPNQIGFALGLRTESFEALQHAELLKAALDAGNLNDEKVHAEHIINIIEGKNGSDFGDLNHDGKIQNPGDGFGLIKNEPQEGYIQGTTEHALLAASTHDATDTIKRFADNVKVSNDAILSHIMDIRDRTLKVNAATRVAPTRADVEAILKLAQQINQGQGSVLTVYQQIQQMATIGLEPVAPGSIVNAPAPDREAPVPESAITVTIADNTFNPGKLTVARGTTVVWRNQGQNAHTVTADDRSFDSKTLSPNRTFQQTFTQPGVYPYYCQIHGGAHGEGQSGAIIVADGPPATAKP